MFENPQNILYNNPRNFCFVYVLKCLQIKIEDEREAT